MFDFDFDLDLGARRPDKKEWAVQLSPTEPAPSGHSQQLSRRARAARRAAQQQLLLELDPDQAEAFAQQEHTRTAARDPSVACLSTELENGNVEYKYKLSSCITNPNRRHQLTTQMKFRLCEGGGECFYYLGVEDDGYPRGLGPRELAASTAILCRMAASLGATARLVEYVPGGFGASAALVHIKEDAEEGAGAAELRVAVAGSMDCGKSTLVAALTHGSGGRPLLDNGCGAARTAVLRHKHEIESGRTSSISQQVLGYDGAGRVLNYAGVSAPTPADIAAAAAQVLMFLDMGGHEKYLKTTLYGLTCMLPDYVLLCVDAAAGVTRTTREHLAVAVALEVPAALLVTKTDAMDAPQLERVLDQLGELMAPVLPSLGGQAQHEAQQQQQEQQWQRQRQPRRLASSAVPLVSSEEQAKALAAALSELHCCTDGAAAASFQQATFPVFAVSCVTGAGLPLLHAFLSRLKPASARRSCQPGGCVAAAAVAEGEQLRPPPPELQLLGLEPSSQLWLPGERRAAGAPRPPGAAAASSISAAAAPAGHFQVVHTYHVAGVGWVVSGITVAGVIEVGRQLLWGPTPGGGFSPVVVSCIQRNHVPVRQVHPGQTATLALHLADGTCPEFGSKEALLSAAAAAQAAAEETAAREAAAAAQAAPTIVFGKPYVPPRPAGSGTVLQALAAGSAPPATAPPAPPPAAAVACLDGASLDALADDLAAELALGDSSDAGASSDADDSLGGFACGGFCADDATSSHATSSLATGAGGRGPPLGRFGLDCGGGGGGGTRGRRTDSCSTSSGSSSSSSRSGSRSGSSGSMGWGALDADGGGGRGSDGSWQDLPSFGSSGGSACGCGDGSTAPGRQRLLSRSSAGAACSGGASSSSLGSPRAPRAQARSQPAAAARRRSAGSAASGAAPLGGSPPTWRSKGAVLLDAAAAPRTFWEFEALLLLLGGHWPARGLRSGCWPPEDGPSEEEEARDGTGAAGAAAPVGRGRRPVKRRPKRCDYAYVIHCNSIRQTARVVFMQELREAAAPQGGPSAQAPRRLEGGAGGGSRGGAQHFGLSASIRAAAALLHGPWQPCAAADAGGLGHGAACGRQPDLGTVVHVRLRFTHRPEWMQPGARLIVRDRSDGHVAAAGFATRLLEPHPAAAAATAAPAAGAGGSQR